ncbi:hypothetical protein SEPCBS57363_001439 [Sporothrix epigloea]|uniref:Zn(2)-C6 fungal-type domain-containing protein n=1 Tax=Sporothrix epigloea TaxID=1892477 RepID=A0ABP0DAB4_9PEZI
MASPASDLTPSQLHEARRRKVRKGTHSCWECRRRKIRCQYASPDDIICIGCQARGSPCRSQEFADETPLPSQLQEQQQAPEKKVAQRLERLESMMEQLMTHIMAGPVQQHHHQQPHQLHQEQQQPGTFKTGPATPQNGHWPSSAGPSSAAHSDASDTASSTHRSVAAPTCYGDQESLEIDDENYKDPVDIVAHVCPKARARQGYGTLDVLDTSTADDTPVAALLGIQDSLSGHKRSGEGSNRGGLTPNSYDNPISRNSHIGIDAADSAATIPESSSNTVASVGRDMSTGGGGNPADRPGGGHANTNGKTVRTSFDKSVPSNAAANTATKDSLTSMHHTRPVDPVSEEWRRRQHLSRLLLSLFPTQEDINTIISSPPSQYVVSLFYSKENVTSGRCEPPSKLHEVPPLTSHPAVIARRLLQLTLCMQQMAPCFLSAKKLQFKEPVAKVMDRIFGVVSHTVASNEEMIGSLEGLQCLILLGQQQSNAGQLRKAWLSYRRAMSLAQLMGLDRGNTRALKSCDPTSDPRTWPTPSALWYRINSCDRYVSLLLGLRAGCQDDDGYSTLKASAANNASPDCIEKEEKETPEETLEKMHTILTGRIIERNHGKISLEQSYAVTRAIDAELRTAASRNLDPLWWELPVCEPYARPDSIYNAMRRSIVQVHHHCILILLHLPYMLRGEHPAAAAARMMATSTSTSPVRYNESMTTLGNGSSSADARRSYNGTYAYSKATCLHSSRAVLCRFMQLRQLGNTAFACRHVDYASLIAAMTLIIGYLGPRPALDSDPNILIAFDKQLQQDRDMIQQVHERLEHIGRVKDEKLSRESAATIEKLMPILDLVAKKPGQKRTAATTSESTAVQEYTASEESLQGHSMRSTASPSDGSFNMRTDADNPYAFTGSALRLDVPYFGTVNIHTNATTGISSLAPEYNQQPPERTFSQHQQQQQQQQQHYDFLTSPTANLPVLDWSSSLSQGSQETADLNAMMIDFDSMPMTGDGGGMTSGNMNNNGNLFGFGSVPAFPDMTGPSEEWVMQGVDTTYWSLLNGGGGTFGGQMG